MLFRLFSPLKSIVAGLHSKPATGASMADDMVMTVYDDGTIIDVTKNAGAVLGVAGEITGRSIFDFVGRADRREVRDALKHAVESAGRRGRPTARLDIRLLRVGKAALTAEIAVSAIGRGRVRAVIRDRREYHARERDMRETAEIAEWAQPKAGAGGGPKDIIADVSHEMKTPLNAIMGFADAIRMETYGPLGNSKYKEYAEFIHNSGAHMMDLIASILDRARLEAGRHEVSPVLTAPGPIAAACAEMVRPEIEKAGLTLTVEIAPDLPDALIDARAVKQILINLLSNAVKFTAEGAVTLSVGEKCGAIDFIVRDTGVGMNKAMLAKLGGRFSEAQKSGVRGAKGSGLGLSLAYSLAKLHGGALKIQSELGEGTTARLTLPVRKARFDQAYSSAAFADELQSQLDRVAAYREDRANRTNRASAA